MKIKTSELIGLALNWAVTKCETGQPLDRNSSFFVAFKYTTDWAQGGPIIEREEISVNWAGLAWTADLSDSVGGYIEHTESGPTPLIAAMRCYVASKLGDKVEIPENLK